MNQKNINCSLSVNDKSSNRQNLLLKMNKINSASPFKIEFDDPADESNRYTDNNFYRILAGGGKIRYLFIYNHISSNKYFNIIFLKID